MWVSVQRIDLGASPLNQDWLFVLIFWVYYFDMSPHYSSAYLHETVIIWHVQIRVTIYVENPACLILCL